ncbi:hypothetical protein OCAE111667_16090 [Occultella aeris]|uniref:Uncharacterized protein n=1 Tax=Occultella aeris TaxID=2761496 RepID=A0A7M4DL78_9MICO|nr:hypothetical protein [Occultella aeris]VZO37974.1 hypothetical protein HALOF300_02894 [Occultella aeris]
MPELPTPPELPRTYLTGELTAPVLARMIGAERLVPVRKGAFVVVDPKDPRWHRKRVLALGRCVAATRLLSRDHVFSHTSAALLHGCALWDVDPRVHLFQSGNPSPGHTRNLVRHVGAIGESERTIVNGLTVTTLERTILDCARTLHPRDALVVVDSAMGILVKPDRTDRTGTDKRTAELRARLLRLLDEPGMRRGRRQGRVVIALADPYAESPGESALRWIALARGLPPPVCQSAVRTDAATYYTDMRWRFTLTRPNGTQRIVTIHAEFDGRIEYRGTGPEASRIVTDEKVREDRIRATRAEVVRAVWEDLAHTDRMFARLIDALPISFVHSLRARPELLRP